MELIVGQVVAVLAGYVADKGGQLLKEGGQAAVDIAERLLQTVRDRLQADPAEARNAERFEANPEGYKAPVEDALRAEVERDPVFGESLAALLDALRQQAPGSVSLVVTGSGAAATHGGVAAGQGGAAAGADGSAWVGTPTPPPRGDDQGR